eukprot:m.40282 g.40282  ORF g.40282 m.40282 type:complete len:195 (-) comp6915_c0_seq1:359-943(-)
MFTPRPGHDPAPKTDGPNIVKMKCPFTGKEFDIDMNNLKGSIAKAHKDEAEKKMKGQEEKYLKEVEVQSKAALELVEDQEQEVVEEEVKELESSKSNDNMIIKDNADALEALTLEEVPEFLKIQIHIGELSQELTAVHNTMNMDYILQSLWDDGPYPLLRTTEDGSGDVLRPIATLKSLHTSGDTIHLFAYLQN